MNRVVVLESRTHSVRQGKCVPSTFRVRACVRVQRSRTCTDDARPATDVAWQDGGGAAAGHRRSWRQEVNNSRYSISPQDNETATLSKPFDSPCIFHEVILVSLLCFIVIYTKSRCKPLVVYLPLFSVQLLHVNTMFV